MGCDSALKGTSSTMLQLQVRKLGTFLKVMKRQGGSESKNREGGHEESWKGESECVSGASPLS